MLTTTLDLPPAPTLGTALSVMREDQQAHIRDASFRVEPSNYPYAAGSSLTITFVNDGSLNLNHSKIAYRARTALGRRLLELRESFIKAGGKLLSAEEVDEEISARRGDYDDD